MKLNESKEETAEVSKLESHNDFNREGHDAVASKKRLKSNGFGTRTDVQESMGIDVNWRGPQNLKNAPDFVMIRWVPTLSS